MYLHLGSGWGTAISGHHGGEGVPPSQVRMGGKWGYPIPGQDGGYPQPEQHNVYLLRGRRYASLRSRGRTFFFNEFIFGLHKQSGSSILDLSDLAKLLVVKTRLAVKFWFRSFTVIFPCRWLHKTGSTAHAYNSQINSLD